MIYVHTQAWESKEGEFSFGRKLIGEIVAYMPLRGQTAQDIDEKAHDDLLARIESLYPEVKASRTSTKVVSAEEAARLTGLPLA